MQLAPKPRRGRDVSRDVAAEKSPDEREQPKLAGGEPALFRIASQAFRMATCHEVAWAWRTRGLNQKLTVGTNRLKAMVLDDYRFVLKQAQEQGCECGTCDMHDIGAPDEPPKGNKTRSARHAKPERGIVEIARRSLCYEGDFELRCAVRAAQPGKATGE
jgi:hypothetical protein